MKYKNWIRPADIRKPETGQIYHCILLDIENELPPYQEIMKFENNGFIEQYQSQTNESYKRFVVSLWRSCPDLPNLDEERKLIEKRWRKNET